MPRVLLRAASLNGSAKRRCPTPCFAAAAVFAVASLSPLASTAGEALAPQAEKAVGMTIESFLDRLMRAESGGRVDARNPRSTALGPFQFIATTWLQVMRAHFGNEIAPLRVDRMLALRTDRAFSRRAAEAYTRENAAHLVAQGHAATFPNLRLAFLVGPAGAVRVLNAKTDASAADLLGTTVIGANPFIAQMAAGDLMRRAARDLDTGLDNIAALTHEPEHVLKAKADGTVALAEKPLPKDGKKSEVPRPHFEVVCDLSRASCRKWRALAERRVTKQRRASR